MRAVSSLSNAVASVLRLVAVGLLLLGVVLFVLGYAAHRQEASGLWHWITGAAGFLSGILLLIFSSPIARRLTRDYE